MLKTLVDIYEVYFDLYVLDANGVVVACGVHRNLIGHDLSDREWFREVRAAQTISVSDLYFSSLENRHTIAYSY